jgi:hypothetical protein
MEATKSIEYLLAKCASKWSERVLDRTIAMHVDLLPHAFAKSSTLFFALSDTLMQLLTQRKACYQEEFSLTSEEVRKPRHIH